MSVTDRVLRDDWHPVALTANLPIVKLIAIQLLDTPLVVWKDSSGAFHAWEDRCPHRGMKLSMGQLHSDTLSCAYHGWQFGSQGRCKHIPALPALGANSLTQSAVTYSAREAFGLVWVCLGYATQAVPAFPEFSDERLRKVWCGPYDVLSSGPRIIENFLDMAHFAYVHEGILGEKSQAVIGDYNVNTFDDDIYGNGIRATGCHAWQPRANSLSREGGMVEYTYRVVRPLTAILTKEPAKQTGFHEAISLHLQPMTETHTRAWIILCMTNFEQTDEELRAFQDTIFMQDKPILENQSPLRLPLEAGMEVSVVCDRMSIAYRSYLLRSGLRYGVVTHASATA